MGRRTHEPPSGSASPAHAHLRQVVVSRTLESTDPDVTVVRDDPVAAVRAVEVRTR